MDRSPMVSRRCLLLGVPATLLAGAVMAQDGVTLTRPLKKGDVTRYLTEVMGSVMGTEFSLRIESKVEISAATPEGETTFVETEQNGQLTVAGAEQQRPLSPPATMKRDRYGRLVSLDLGGDGGGIVSAEVGKALVMVAEPLLPTKAVKQGDGWETELENPAAAGKKFVVKGSFIGTEKLDGTDAWKVRQTAEIAAGADAPIVQEDTFWLDPASGRVLKQESTLKNLPSQFGSMSWTATRTVIK